MKQIRKEEMELLFKNGILRNSNKGIVDRRGYTVTLSKTRNKTYIEDKYVDMARELI